MSGIDDNLLSLALHVTFAELHDVHPRLVKTALHSAVPLLQQDMRVRTSVTMGGP